MPHTGWVIVRWVASIPFWLASGIFLMVICVAWLPFFEEVGTGIFLTSVYGGIAIVLLLPAVLLWGRQYLELATCVYLLGVAAHVALLGGFTGLIVLGLFDSVVPEDFDLEYGKRVAIGSLTSAAMLFVVALLLLRQGYLRFKTSSTESRDAV